MDCTFFLIWHVFLILSLGNLEYVCVIYKSIRTFYCSAYWQFPFSDCPFDCTDSFIIKTYGTTSVTYYKLISEIP